MSDAMRGALRLLFAVMATWGTNVSAQDVSAPPDEGLLVVYGALAPTREGDVDHREVVFFSVPKDLRDRVYVRAFDPEMRGAHDFRYGRAGNTQTIFRVYGGAGAFQDATLPTPVAAGSTPKKQRRADVLAAQPGEILREAQFGSEAETDGQWVSIGSVRARQGDVVGDRAWFRIEVLGADGDDGNGFNLDVSLLRDAHRRPQELQMLAYQPTIRWPGSGPGTRVEFEAISGPITVQNFDGAAADLRINRMYSDVAVRASGQNVWASEDIAADVLAGEDVVALTLQGGFETPNDVTLSLFDAEGAALPIIMPPRQAPAPERPEARPRARELADCSSVAFDGSLPNTDPLMSYDWAFGDGGQSDEPVIVYSYAAPGKLNARLRVLLPGTRAARGAESEVPVHVRVAPRAVAGAPVTVAPGEVVPFSGVASVPSDSPITRYQWTFGDGAIAETAEVDHVFAAPGSYRAVLRVMDDSQHPCNFGVATRLVTVNFPPVAEAGTDVNTIVGRAVTLDGIASYDVDGGIDSYRWDMGDGSTLDGSLVTHVYSAPGVYRVALAVTDDSGVGNDTSQDFVTIRVNAPPVPVIDGPTEPVAVGEAVPLDGSRSSDADGVILSHQWDFGDGAIGEGPFAEYAWASPGVYEVALTVIDDSGTQSASQSTSFEVIVNTRPIAEAGPDQFVTASEVQFDGTGSRDIDGQIASYLWEFGDGRTGQGPQPLHYYALPGSYEVSLTVIDDSGAPQSSHRDTMTVTVNARPIADAGPSLTVAPGEDFVLDAGASLDPDGSVAEHLWLFEGGLSKEGARVSHTFDAPGLYRIRLQVSDDFVGGGAVDESEVLITVNAPPVAQAGPDLRVAPDDNVRFDARSSFDTDGALATFQWEFDDLQLPLEAAVVERAWPVPGVYNARLVVRDSSGVANSTAQDSVTIAVNHRPKADAGPVIDTDRLLVTLDASGSSDADGDALMYLWDFGDGTPVMAGEVVSHVFPRAGQFPVTLRVDDGAGLRNSGDVDATTVIINAAPVANAGGNKNVCSGQSVLFDASASSDEDGDLLRYAWDFGDATGSDLINPTKTYEMPGTYPVTLKVEDESGSTRGSDLDRIAVIVREGPIANAGPDMRVCVNQEVRMDGTGSTDADGSVNAFEWTFGDGSRASGATPIKSFERAGDYEVTLTITGDAVGQCSPLDKDTVKVTVLSARSLEIDAVERAPSGEAVQFAAVLGDEPGTGEPVSFDWAFSDGATAQGQQVAHVFAEPGEYTATLTTTLEGGTQDCGELVSRHKVRINAAPKPAIDAPDLIASGVLARFDASGATDVDGVITDYIWDFGDGATGRGVAGTHRYDAPGVYTLSLAVVDDADVANSTVVMRRDVVVNPAPKAGLSVPAALCVGTPQDWQLAVADDVAVKWSFGDGASAEGAMASHVFDKPGLFPVRVSTDDGRALSNSQQIEEVYARVNAPPVADAGPDRVVCPGEDVVFRAGAYDVDGEVTDLIWRFSDGEELRGAEVQRRFEVPGSVSVELTALDNSGAVCNAGVDVAQVLVNAAPIIDAGPDRDTPVGAAHDVLRFDASGVTDPDGHGVEITWTFGDGTQASGAVARHAYQTAGQFTATAVARDSTGLACGVSQDTAVVQAVARDGFGAGESN
ncbi:PKD domain-containing protein [Shimia sp. NS0008-38b]|uniref:PKD domain-containing protein n=1 Tax=Shimia sp. NS0008-38b TaxID=3127653 RepID=UPI0033429DE6